MHFELKNVTPYQDPIDITQLRTGNICYSVWFDGDLPVINTMYFIGKNLEPDDSKDGDDLLYFQDSTSYFEGVRYSDDDSTPKPPVLFLVQPASKLNGFYDLQAALQILAHASLTKKK